MMSELIQQILSSAVVLAASAFVFKHYYDKHKIKTGCAACKLMQGATRPRSNHTNKLYV